MLLTVNISQLLGLIIIDPVRRLMTIRPAFEYIPLDVPVAAGWYAEYVPRDLNNLDLGVLAVLDPIRAGTLHEAQNAWMKAGKTAGLRTLSNREYKVLSGLAQGLFTPVNKGFSTRWTLTNPEEVFRMKCTREYLTHRMVAVTAGGRLHLRLIRLRDAMRTLMSKLPRKVRGTLIPINKRDSAYELMTS